MWYVCESPFGLGCNLVVCFDHLSLGYVQTLVQSTLGLALR